MIPLAHSRSGSGYQKRAKKGKVMEYRLIGGERLFCKEGVLFQEKGRD